MKTAHLSLMSGIVVLSFALMGAVFAESPYKSSSDFSKYAEKMRESALLHLEPQVIVPTTARPFSFGSSSYPWKNDIVTTIFWVGESASARNPVHNRSSSWDLNWESSFGGFDDPDPTHRRNFIPVNFVPRQNPFYCALPYTDVTARPNPKRPSSSRGSKMPSSARDRASAMIAGWPSAAGSRARSAGVRNGATAAPSGPDHYQYVFGDERPKPNLNQGAGLDVSPAVRDYLGSGPSFDTTDWRFVE